MSNESDVLSKLIKDKLYIVDEYLDGGCRCAHCDSLLEYMIEIGLISADNGKYRLTKKGERIVYFDEDILSKSTLIDTLS